MDWVYIILTAALLVVAAHVWRKYQAVPPAVVLGLSAVCCIVGHNALPMALWISAIFLFVYKAHALGIMVATAGVVVFLYLNDVGMLFETATRMMG